MEEEMGSTPVAVGPPTDETFWRTDGQGEELQDTEAVSEGAQTAAASCLRPEPQEWQLLPGLPDDKITLPHIVPKLPWSDFSALWWASRPWRDAIENRQVFNARVKSHSTETFVVIRSYNVKDDISLFSVRDKSCYRLPPLPHLEGRIPQLSEITSVDNKIYALGVWNEPDEYGGSQTVYVFNPVGKKKWEKCADMLEPKPKAFGCGVVHGKIYVFGASKRNPVGRPEVYDPNTNAWSHLAPTPSPRCLYKVLTMGDEIYMVGGEVGNPDEDNSDFAPGNGRQLSWQDALSWLAYHTVEDEWREVKPVSTEHKDNEDNEDNDDNDDNEDFFCKDIFTAQEKFHVIKWISDIDVFDEETNTWQFLHYPSRVSLATGDPAQDYLPYGDGAKLYTVIAVNLQLFGASCLVNIETPSDDNPFEPSEPFEASEHSENSENSENSVSSRRSKPFVLLQSHGFYGHREGLVWHQEAAFSENFTLVGAIHL